MEPPGETSEPTQAVSPGVGVPYENTKTYHSPYNTSPYVVPENGRTPPAYIPPGTPVEYGEPVEIMHHAEAAEPIPVMPSYVTPEPRYQPLQPVVPATPVEPVAPVAPARPVSFWRRENVIYVMLSILETLLAIRLFLKLFGANPDAAFSALIYGLTYPFVLPFTGVFPDAQARGSTFELSTLLALIVYPILAWVIVRILRATRGHSASLTA